MSKLDLYQRAYNNVKARGDMLTRDLEASEKGLRDAYKEEKQYLEALSISQIVAQQTQEKIQHQLCDIVTSVLDMVFPDKYTFHVEFNIKRGKTEADLYLKDAEGNKYNPLDDNGGGVVVICAFAFRIACISLTRGEKVLVLDEPFISVQGDEQERAVGLFLEMVRDRLGYQIIMVANKGGYLEYADRIIEVK